jgi:tetratricopeptide (TPR) repeat protein
LDETVSLHDLAVSRQAEGRRQEAVPLCQQALTLVERAVGPHHPDVANLLNTLAGPYEELGDYAEAERLAQRSVVLMEGVTGSPEVAVLRVQSLGTLAGIYRVHGRYAEAEPLFQRALVLAEAALGPGHPAVAMTLNNLAVLYKAAGEYAKAEPLYQRALAIFETALGPTHPKVITCRRNYAQLQRERQRQAEAAAREGHGKRAQTSRARRAKKE